MTTLSIIEAYAAMSRTDPHRHNYGKVVCKLMEGIKLNDDDIAVLIQGFAFQPVVDLLDLQDALDAINERFETSYTING